MTTIKRFTPDYKMHAVRFEAFAREAEHGEFVRFDAHQQVVSAVEAERDAQQKRADALEIRLRNALTSEQEAIQRAHAANQTADALAVENAALKDDYQSTPALKRMGWPKTPATDAALAAIQAQGVEKFADHMQGGEKYSRIAEYARGFATELREAK
ncbi:hypothetical protein [Serratia ureilytica]|uniref:hypothetical protein n=1 Tax=Serratia ureilytica TaxID=300181 RepID=UPI003FA76D5A